MPTSARVGATHGWWTIIARRLRAEDSAAARHCEGSDTSGTSISPYT